MVTLKIDQIYADPIHWWVKLSVNCMYVILGYILGYALISRYVYTGSDQAIRKGYELNRKDGPITNKVGAYRACFRRYLHCFFSIFLKKGSYRFCIHYYI